MSKSATLSSLEIEELDRFYREGGLRQMVSAHVHYHDPNCPHPGCTQKMEWIDFQLELYGDAEHVYKPLVRAWWEGTGFVGRCPSCNGWIRSRRCAWKRSQMIRRAVCRDYPIIGTR